MKKTVFLSILFALLCLCGTANATAPLLDGELHDHQNGVEVTCWYADNDPDVEKMQSAVCAVYDGGGQLLTVAALDAAKDAQTVVIPCKTAEVDHVKLMTLDADRKPFRPVRTLKPSAESSEAPQFLTDPIISENTVSVTGSAMAYAKVTADRNCRLYWALYKHDIGQPTADRFKSDNLPGSDARGMETMSANAFKLVKLNNLADQTDYDLWLWLTTADFKASSYMRRLTFRTIDGTAPVFTKAPEPTTVKERSVTLQYALNENATFYWVLVENGTRFPNPPTGGGSVTKDYAIKQVVGGNGGINHGNVAAFANASGAITLSNLTPEKSYQFWYVAKDSAGNYSEFRVGSPDSTNAAENPRGVCMLTVSTLDKLPPSVTVEADSYPDGHPETPYADTSLRLVFSEGIRRFSTGAVLSEVYAAVTAARNESARNAAKETLAAFLRETVILQTVSDGVYRNVSERVDGTESDWTIDYRNATVSAEGDNLVVAFPATNDAGADSAIRLLGGKTYCFQLQDLSDLSENLNQIKSQKTTPFTTMPAQILLKEITLASSNYPSGVGDVDFAFTAAPVAISRADGDTSWDFLFWSDTSCVFEVYRRSRLSTTVVYDETWAKVRNPDGSGGETSIILPANASGMSGKSMHLHLCQYAVGGIPSLKALEDGRIYEYAVRFSEIDGETERKLWDSEMQFGVTVAAGSASALLNLSAGLTQERFNSAKSSGTVLDIGSPAPFVMTRRFYATAAPTFANGAPTFDPSDTSVSMWFQMNRPGVVHYLLAPADWATATTDTNGRAVTWNRSSEIPRSGSDTSLTPFAVRQPSQTNILQQRFSGAGVKTGSLAIDGRGGSINVTGLKSNANYFAYFVLQGSGTNYSANAQLFRFTTTEAAPPSVTLELDDTVTTLKVNREAFVDYLVVDMDNALLAPILSGTFWNNPPSGGASAPSYSLQVSSVLEAMKTNTGNGSVFDLYATGAYKATVAEYIRQSVFDGESVIGVGKGVSVSPTLDLEVDAVVFSMREDHQYAFLCVAQGKDGGANAFRAAYPISPPDSNPLMVTKITQDIALDDGEAYTNAPTCTGDARLTFDSELYYIDGDTLKKVDLGNIGYAKRDDDFTPLAAHASSTPNGQIRVDTRSDQANRKTSVIDLHLAKASNGATITFPTNLCDAYGNVHNVTLTVTLNITSTPRGTDAASRILYDHDVTVSISPSWDARTSK